jgi:tetratricopeptide (TPR) repeat protein
MQRPSLKRLAAIAIALVAFYSIGCAKNTQGVGNLSEKQANSLGAQHSKFEKAEDPPFTAQTHFAAGQLAESQEAPLSAINYYQAALKVDKHHQPSLFRLAVIHTKLKDYPSAIECWKRYLKETKDDGAAYGNLGLCYELAGRKPEAESCYQAGVAKDPANVSCRVNYGLFLARLGRIDEATAQLNAVLTAAQTHYNLGSIYEQQGKRDQAKTHFRQALQLDANLTDAKTRLAALD